MTDSRGDTRSKIPPGRRDQPCGVHRARTLRPANARVENPLPGQVFSGRNAGTAKLAGRSAWTPTRPSAYGAPTMANDTKTILNSCSRALQDLHRSMLMIEAKIVATEYVANSRPTNS